MLAGLLCGRAPPADRLQHAPRKSLFHRLHDLGRIPLIAFADQQMNDVT